MIATLEALLKRMSQAEIARRLDVGPSTVNRWCREKSGPNPHFKALLEKLLEGEK